jgi:hypothetical protein
MAGVGYDTPMLASLALFLFIVSVTLATAQSSFDPREFEDKNLDNADVNQLWRTLGISGKIRETTVDESRETNQSFDCGTRDDDYCKAQFFNLAGCGKKQIWL